MVLFPGALHLLHFVLGGDETNATSVSAFLLNGRNRAGPCYSVLVRLLDECLRRLKVLWAVLNPVLSCGDRVPAGTAAVGRGYSGCRASVLFSPNLLQLVLFSSF